MEQSCKIVGYFEDKTIFVTGVTGFLAKIFIEKILRTQPKVKKIYLLIRPTTKRSVEQRLQDEIVNAELFRVLREGCETDLDSTDLLMSKLIPVSGDISHENLGINDSKLREEMWCEIDIIVNSAATTKFDERYDVGFGINVLGAMHVQDFAEKCLKLEMLLHVSTAYVRGTREGIIPEKLFHMGETLCGSKISYLDINLEKKMIEEKLIEFQTQKSTEKEITRAIKDFGIERARLHGWPNTYVFTKAMGEMLLGNFKGKPNYKVIIIRPTIITSTYKEPFPGWTEGVRTVDSIFAGFGKGKMKVFVGDPNTILDMIPGDMVVNCMVAAIASHSNDENNLFIHHIGSSMRNPVKYKEMKSLMHCYLTENPMADCKGNIIRVEPTTLNTMVSFRHYIATRYVPLVKILKLINVISFNYFESQYTKAWRRISHAVYLAELYEPYLFSQVIFDDDNTENLRKIIRGSNVNVELLNFDPNCIQWDKYFMNTHFPGIVKYVLK